MSMNTGQVKISCVKNQLIFWITMFKSRLHILILAAVFAAFFIGNIQIVSPQESSTPIYFVTGTFSNGTYQYELWEYGLSASKAKRILILQPNKQTIGKSFSANELSHLRAYVEQSEYLEKGWAENNPAESYPRALWRFDGTHLLIRMDYEVQDGYARMSSSATLGRYGYSEYSLVELGAVPKVTGMFKLDYHDTAYKDWPYTNPFTYPQSLWLNPTQPKLVLLLTPESAFCSFLLCSSLLILDYSQSPIQTTLVPLASNPVWSPDGNHLAYLHTKCGSQFKNCISNLEIMSMDDGSREDVPNWNYSLSTGWDSSALASFAWLDNQNLFYRVFPPQYVLDSIAWSYQSYNLTTKSIADFPLDKIQDDAVITHKSGLYYWFEAVKGFTGSIFPIILENGQRKFLSGSYPIYNSRFPDRMIFRESNSQQLTLFESGNKQTIVDLSTILPENEWVAAIAS